MIIMSDDWRQHHQQLLLMDIVLEVNEDVFVVDVLNVGNKADIMDVSSLEAVAMTNSNDDGDGKDDVDIVDDSKKKTATIINNNKNDEKDGDDDVLFFLLLLFHMHANRIIIGRTVL
mmetsp:Transcript_39546/g.45178  ORF Transcript_39546/g.45178 Transcript_39546/m.45178 type:complete len:117 (-) Transcript_39546:23-373(-)